LFGRSKIGNVSVANLAFRLHTVELLTDWQYRQTFIDLVDEANGSGNPNRLRQNLQGDGAGLRARAGRW